MNRSRHVAHVAFCDSSYFVRFDDNSWSSRGVPNVLTNPLEKNKSDIEFLALGSNEQYFYRLANGKFVYKIHDNYINELLRNSTLRPHKIWFNENNGYIIQFEDFNLAWSNIPEKLRLNLKLRSKTLPKIEHITFGPDDIWWIAFQDGSSSWSSNIPRCFHPFLNKMKCLVLDPMSHCNYFVFKSDGGMTWSVDDRFSALVHVRTDGSVHYINPQTIRYTQNSISHEFANGQRIFDLRDELEQGLTTVDEVPIIDVIRTQSGNIWSLNNRRLWCFRNASNVNQIPVRFVKQRPNWFDHRIRILKHPFHVNIRFSEEVLF